MNVGLDVTQNRAVLPPNVYKIKDVYPDEKYHIRASFQHIKNFLSLPDYKEDIVYINYVGTPIDKDCLPLIYKDHQAACETYCKINSFEEDVMFNKINHNLYFDWKQRFDGMIQGAKVNFRDWDNQRYEDMDIIFANQIPKVGYVPLVQHMFTGNTVNNMPDDTFIPSSSFYTNH